MTKFSPLLLPLALSGSVHLGLFVILAWNSSAAMDTSANVVEVNFVESNRSSLARPVVRRLAPPRDESPVELSKVEEASGPPMEEALALDAGKSSEHYEAYASEVVRQLNRHKVYPEVALKLRQQGRVKVRFRVDRSGDVLNAEILEKSAHDPLNNAAKRLIDEIRNFRPFPDEVKDTTWLFTVPIEYTM